MVSRVACLRNRSLRTVRRRKSSSTTTKQNCHLKFQPAHYNPSHVPPTRRSRGQIRQGLRCNNCCIGVAGSSSTRARLELT